jgi:hypothetical protein
MSIGGSPLLFENHIFCLFITAAESEWLGENFVRSVDIQTKR